MAERRRQRKRPESHANIEDEDKPAKVEYEIAKYLRSHLPPKQTTLFGHKVDYFIANRAIDLLMDSKWAKADKRTDEVMFPSRESVISFMNVMLRHQFFHRAKAIFVKKEIKNKKPQETNDSTDEGNKSETKKINQKNVGSDQKSANNKNKEQETTTTKKEKKKVKLDMHRDQVFVDLNEPYVWIYDYIPMRTWLIGGALVIAAIAICLFPLWPRTLRNYVYYLSIIVAVFLFFIIALALLKLVVFAIVWCLTFGVHHLWILPNLTEDVGFLESFWPLYKYEYKGTDKGKSENNEQDVKRHKKKKKNDEDGEQEDNNEGNRDDKEQTDNSDTEIDEKLQSTNGTNGFEILDSNECKEDN